MIEYNLNLVEKLYILNSFYFLGLVDTLAEAVAAVDSVVLAPVAGAADSVAAAGASPPLKAFITYIDTLQRSPGFN